MGLLMLIQQRLMVIIISKSRCCKILLHSYAFSMPLPQFPELNENNVPFDPALRLSEPEVSCPFQGCPLSPSRTALIEQGAASMHKNGLRNLLSHCGIFSCEFGLVRQMSLYIPAQAGMVMKGTTHVLKTETIAKCQSSGGQKL